MRKRIRGIAALGLALIVIGCGDGGAVTTQAPVSTAASGGDAGGDAVSTSAPTTVITVTTQAAGGGAVVGVCDVVAAEELAEIFGVASVTTRVLTGPPDNCIVASDTGDPLTAWSLNTAQASSLFDSFTADPSSIDVPGIGDKAAIVQNTGLLVLIHDNLMVISVSGGANLSEEEAVEASKRIGAIAASRM